MIYNIPPSTNITNLFGYLLNGMSKKDKGHVRVGVCALLWPICHVRNNFISNKRNFPSACYSFSYVLDPYVIISSADGSTPGHEY
jgi:hypothetical protein